MIWGETKTTLSKRGVRVIEGSSYQGVKLQQIYDGNPGEIDFGLS